MNAEKLISVNMIQSFYINALSLSSWNSTGKGGTITDNAFELWSMTNLEQGESDFYRCCVSH